MKTPLPLAGGVGVGPECQRANRFRDQPTPTPNPSRKREGDFFAAAATHLAGLSAALLGWRPDEFWNATPTELATVIAALSPEQGDAADGALVARLKEQFPDG